MYSASSLWRFMIRQIAVCIEDPFMAFANAWCNSLPREVGLEALSSSARSSCSSSSPGLRETTWFCARCAGVDCADGANKFLLLSEGAEQRLFRRMDSEDVTTAIVGSDGKWGWRFITMIEVRLEVGGGELPMPPPPPLPPHPPPPPPPPHPREPADTASALAASVPRATSPFIWWFSLCSTLIFWIISFISKRRRPRKVNLRKPITHRPMTKRASAQRSK